MQVAKVLSSTVSIAPYSFWKRLLDVLLSRWFDTDALKRSTKRISDCRRIVKKHMAQVVVATVFENKIARIS